MPSHTYLEKGLTIFNTRMNEPLGRSSFSHQLKAPPFITLSREAGAGASTLGQLLIPMLNEEFGRDGQSWMFLDKNLLHFALTSHHLPERLAEFLPEDRVSETKAIIGELVGLHPPLWELEHQIGETILQLARSGRVIFAGRAAHLITRTLPGGFHIRLVAGKETRIMRLMERQSCDRTAAGNLVGELDQARRRFVRQYFGADIDDPHTYDIVINTDRLPPAAVAAIVAEGLRQRQRES